MMEALVFKSKRGTPVTTSLIVADYYEKRHSDVLFAIETIILQLPENECERHFALTYYSIDQPNGGKRKEKVYLLTRSGFTLLVMGFTGNKAMKFKITFINAFDEMEKQLTQRWAIPGTYAEALELAAAQARDIETKNKIIELQAPKVDYANRVIDTENMVDIGQAAKLLKLPYGRNKFFKHLREDGIFFKNRNEPLQEFIDRGYFKLFVELIETNTHGKFSVIKVLVTQKGLYWLSKKYGGSYESGLPELKVS
jgi:anti-repressor protein